MWDVLHKSVNYWQTLEGGKDLAGYSFTGAVSLYAYLRDGDNAYAQIRHFLHADTRVGLLLPNTMYVEIGGKDPVIEIPLSAVTSIAELLLQTIKMEFTLFLQFRQIGIAACLKIFAQREVLRYRQNGRMQNLFG